MWVLTKIDPTTFNVVSDLIAKVVAGLLQAALGFVYPQMVWTSIKRGNGVELDGIIAPPPSLWAAARQYFHGRRSGLLLLIVSLILLTVTFSHTLVDVFMEFAVVEVGTNQTLFLGSTPRGVSTYKLIGDRFSTVITVTHNGNSSNSSDFTVNVKDPTGPRDMALLVKQADLIAEGLSRLSFLPPARKETAYAIFPGEKPKEFPGDLGIQCHGSPDYPNIHEMVTYWLGRGDGRDDKIVMLSTNYNVSLLDCDYEELTPYKTISETPSENGWRVTDGIRFDSTSIAYLDSHSTLGEDDFVWTVAVFNEELADTDLDPFEIYLWLTENETTLPSYRGFRGWKDLNNETKIRDGGTYDRQYGRRVRDGLTFRLGHVWWWENDTMPAIDRPHPGSIEFQVEYSLLTGPGATNAEGYIEYTLSSWSRNCLFQDPDTKEISLIVADNVQNVAGCVIDFVLHCSSSFPQDERLSYNTTLEVPKCVPMEFDVTLLSGNIVVDPYMLAAYAGVATRNRGLNDLLDDSLPRIAVNSLAAAYILTRETVSGTVATTGVRASIGPEYVVFMILPLLFILPLLVFFTRGAPPVPRSVWDILVLARGDDKIPRHGDSDYSSYPPCPKKLAFGIIVSEKAEAGDKLGLGVSFVPLTHPLPEPSKNGAPKQEQPTDSWQDAGEPKQHA